MPPCINATISILKKLQYNFPKMGGDEGRLEFFQKFIRFGSGILPLELFEVDDNGDSGDDDLSHHHLPIADWGKTVKIRVLWMGGSLYYLRTGLLGTRLCLKID